MPAGSEIMTSKRNREDERKAKSQRRKKISKPQETINKEKREALRRLFGRICSSDLENNRQPPPEEDYTENEFFDENEDPLLDSVPVDMDPEQLGFLVCAQETLRFLHGRGIPIQHPVFTRLRSRLLRGIDELAMA